MTTSTAPDGQPGPAQQARDPGAGLLQVEGIEKSYGELAVLDDVSFTVAPRTAVAIVGPSGCGKSTLLEVIGGLRRPDRGSVRLDGRPVTAPRLDMGIVFQEESTLPWRTVVRNVEFPLQMAGVGRRERRARAREALELVGLWDFRDVYPHMLSGGMRQRVSIARLLACRPRILLMDEPFGALDEQTRLRLGLDVVRLAQETGASMLLITHSIQEAVLLADRVLVLSRRPGRIALDLDVDIPAPRTLADVGSPEGGRLMQAIWRCVQREASPIGEAGDHG